jgi:hypothetical protein
MSVQALRDQAERCKRLANSIYNPAAAAELEAHARALEEQAKRLEAARLSAPSPTTGEPPAERRRSRSTTQGGVQQPLA